MKIMEWRMAIKKSSPQFDISFAIFRERFFFVRVGFYNVGCSIFKTEIVGS